ncbi:histidine kinase sensor domain-containing protein [Methylophaga thalassica]|uniref:HAMP domain-containing sensor histidine kinase n=1 Tax=Methylophaga thalassica TaxID=40223 RepID=UPI002E7B67E6|nr:histidine kinase sensor domain-containing protein [Methylophaga thalassica]WVI86336.1 histidine kinase sensor domain-containing protein [Methylophaga thalassica]
MKRRLLWKLVATIVIGTVLLFWLIHLLMLHTEQHMSFIAERDQGLLKEYAKKAEKYYLADDIQSLDHWIKHIEEKEHTWAAVVTSQVTPIGNSDLSEAFQESFGLGRDISWKIHLYFKENPIMDLPIADGRAHFLITLPDRMRPGAYWFQTSLLLQIALPLLLMTLISVIIYRHVMSPLSQLEKATRQFSDGNFSVRVGKSLAKRQDEITALGETFDGMAERIGHLIQTQRHLISDLSHELRTPLARVELALSWAENQNLDPQLIERIRYECLQMRAMVEDTLTLAWLDNERPDLRQETLDLIDLIDSILDDARFEFPDRQLIITMPEQAIIENSSARAVGHAFENILRNALSHTPKQEPVKINVKTVMQSYLVEVDDVGPGVAEQYLSDIFKPFFRLAQASRENHRGFGVGLSLAKRHIEVCGGQLVAENLVNGGLRMTITLPTR